jgi:hypothetical protein
MSNNSEAEAAVKVKAFNKKHKFKKDPTSVVACFFLEPKDLSVLLGIPNFEGISIYLGFDDKEGEVLILAPAIKGSDLQNVYALNYSVNQSETVTSESTVVTLKPGQCPPPPPGCNNCLCA